MMQTKIETMVETSIVNPIREETLIQATGLWKTYKSGGKHTIALSDVNIHVKEGEIVCLLGPNGAGKTTLVKILSTLLLPDKGQAIVMGYDVVSQGNRVRKVIGYAGQDSERSAFFRLTVRENLVFFASAFYGLHKAEANERIEEMAGEFGFKDCLDQYFISLSGGQKQTFVIMRALITRPKVVFMDEPSKSLDPLTASKIRKYLRDYARKRCAAIVVTTHNMREAEEIGDRVIMMNKGKVIFDGTPEKMRESVTRTEVIQINGNSIHEEVKKQLAFIKGVIGIQQEGSGLRIFCEDAYEILPIIVDLFKNNGYRPGIRVESLTLEEAFKIMVEGEAK